MLFSSAFYVNAHEVTDALLPSLRVALEGLFENLPNMAWTGVQRNLEATCERFSRHPCFPVFTMNGIWRPGSTLAGMSSFPGVTGCRPDGTVAHDPEEQFRDAFTFLGETLGAGGLDWKDIVEMTTYHVDLRKHLDAFVKVKDAFIAAPYPAWSCIGTTELITEGTLVEIRIICQRAGIS